MKERKKERKIKEIQIKEVLEREDYSKKNMRQNVTSIIISNAKKALFLFLKMFEQEQKMSYFSNLVAVSEFRTILGMCTLQQHIDLSATKYTRTQK